MTSYLFNFSVAKIYGQVILSHICNTIEWIRIILGLTVRADTVSDFILIVGHFDLYLWSSNFASCSKHYDMDLHYTRVNGLD